MKALSCLREVHREAKAVSEQHTPYPPSSPCLMKNQSPTLTCVRSTGKPKLSQSRKASCPDSLPPSAAAAAFLKRSMPLVRVREKAVSCHRAVGWDDC